MALVFMAGAIFRSKQLNRPPSRREASIGAVGYQSYLETGGFVMPSKTQTKRTKRKWSADVTEHSHALDLENDVFKGSPKSIAQSLKKSAEESTHRKSTPYQSAMSMLTFYINRAGKNLSDSDKERLESAKDELRAAFGKETANV
jgi:hypothetical protein